MLNAYIALDNMIEEMVRSGRSDLDPIVRSMSRQLHKRYLVLTESEQKLIWANEDIMDIISQR